MSATPYQIRRYHQRKQDGLCVDCGCKLGSDGTKTKCRPCADDSKSRTAKYMQKKGKIKQVFACIDGKCFNCGEFTYHEEKYGPCYTCHFKLLAWTHLGSRSRWREIENLWNQQNGICPYTGIKLEFGVDASIDHILPRSRFPELAKDISNLEFVHNHVNHMKKNMTKEEFMCFLHMLNMNLFNDNEEPSPWAESLKLD